MVSQIYTITGCTAVGKTDLSLEFAEKHNAEIISCDSLLVYSGMNIGTAKPSADELRRVKHFCIDICNLSENFNVDKYLKYAKSAADDIISRGKNIVVCGGTGFYLKSFYYPVVDDLEISESIHTFVDELFAKHGLETVVAELKKVSDEFPSTFDFHNSRRVIPALKRCLATGLNVKQLATNIAETDFPFKNWIKHTIFLSRTKEDLHSRAKTRIDKMINIGLIDEVRFLLKNGLENNISCANSIGYRETIAWLKNQTSVDDLKAEILQNTMKLIKKQLTWFKKQIPIDEIVEQS